MAPPPALVIGAGQAGLATSYWLSRLGLPHEVLDAGSRLGDSWRSRYDSLTLFTPRAFDALPGLRLTGDQDGYPTGAEFADYLELYARQFSLPVRMNTRVVGLEREGASFLARLQSGEQLRARTVVVASGGFQMPVTPAFASGFDGNVRQLTAVSYRRPSDIPDGPVLVVGDGASGRDIAVDLVATHKVLLACGRPRRLLPERLAGRSTWRWLSALGLLKVGGASPVGRLMRKADPFPNRQRGLDDLRRLGVDIRPRATAAKGRQVTFSDGAVAQIGAVIWALGYRDETSWMEVTGALGSRGEFLHERGRSPVAGLYYVGRPWQRNRGSALVLGVGEDARLIAEHLAARLKADAPRV